MNVPRRSDGGTALAAAPAPAPSPYPNEGPSAGAGTSGSGKTLTKEEEEEETLGQLRDRQMLASARAAVPGPRAAFVHIKVEDSSSGDDTDGKGAAGGDDDGEGEEEEGEGEQEKEQEEEEEGEQEEEEEDEAQPRDSRAHVSGASLKGGSEAVHPQSLPPAARSEPVSLRAGLRVPRRVADNTIPYNDHEQPEEEEWEEEAGFAPVLRNRAIGGPAGSSQVAGVFWDKQSEKWRAQSKGKRLGHHTTKEAAARAYSKYLEDGSTPVDHRGASTSQFTGVSWAKAQNKWNAQCKGKHLGYHTTVDDAARAYSKYLKDGVDPVEHQDGNTSQFTGVHRDKNKNRWRAQCKRKDLGVHTSEEAAARAYNVEAERVGRPLNVIPPTGVAGAGAGAGPGAGSDAVPKRAAPKTPATLTPGKNPKRAAPMTSAAPASSKMMKL